MQEVQSIGQLPNRKRSRNPRGSSSISEMEVFSWAASAVLGSYSTQGAIDVIAIRKKSGIIDCSPFHVKLSLPSIGKVFSKTVKLRVNGQLVSVSMKLGPAGEAFFIQRTSTIKHHSEPLKCVESNTSSNVMESDSR